MVEHSGQEANTPKALRTPTGTDEASAITQSQRWLSTLIPGSSPDGAHISQPLSASAHLPKKTKGAITRTKPRESKSIKKKLPEDLLQELQELQKPQ